MSAATRVVQLLLNAQVLGGNEVRGCKLFTHLIGQRFGVGLDRAALALVRKTVAQVGRRGRIPWQGQR